MSDIGLGLQTPLPIDPLGQAAVAKAAAAARGADPKAAEKAAHDFESILLQKVFEEMQKTVPESGLLDSETTEQFQGIFWMYLAQDVAAKGGIGLWKELAREIARSGGAGAPGKNNLSTKGPADGQGAGSPPNQAPGFPPAREEERP
jgi:Rod binding domain-containing protein